MEWASDSYWASNRGTYARQVSERKKGKNTGERAQNSQRLAAAMRTTSKCAGSYRAQREASDRGSKPIWKEIGPSTKDNRRTGASAQQVVMETYHLTGKNNGERQELPKTLRPSEDHQEKTRRRLQGAKRSLRQRLEPHPLGSRANHQGQP